MTTEIEKVRLQSGGGVKPENGVSRFTLLIGAFRELSAEFGRRVK
jgi:hypothetical protein